MIISLNINNFALIDSLDIKFNKGFTVLTGETGAGKSIILGALSLILGSRADAKSVKDGETKCVIEGEFDISGYNLNSFFDENDIDYDNGHCIIRRELYATGKSRAFVNDTPAPLSLLKILTGSIIDIHSQHQNLLLGENLFQLRVLDILSHNESLIENYKKEYNAYKKLIAELATVKEEAKASGQESDYLNFQFQQLSEANLKEGEQEELEQEVNILNNAEDIKSTLFSILSILENSDGGIIPILKDANNRINSLRNIYSKISDIAERLESDYIDLKDLAKEIDHMQDSVTFDPARLEFIRERLDLLYSLQQKHHVSTEAELIQLFKDIEIKLENISGFDERIEQLEKELTDQKNKCLALANQLSEKRKQTAKIFTEQLINKMQPLGMPNIRFKVDFSEKINFDETGIDNISFLFSANKNQTLLPVADIASGGEVSRLMLVIKSLIASNSSLPIIIFDEVDTGVSGEIADKMGDIMKEMSKCMQVITISHLPQVAGKGDNHYKVYKEDTEESTTTHIVQLTKDERIDELARMLSGSILTEQARDNARVLLKNNNIS